MLTIYLGSLLGVIILVTLVLLGYDSLSPRMRDICWRLVTCARAGVTVLAAAPIEKRAPIPPGPAVASVLAATPYVARSSDRRRLSLGIAILAGGVVVVGLGIRAADSFASPVHPSFTGSPPEFAFWLSIGIATGVLAGIGLGALPWRAEAR